jgi:hypothetical protein
MGRALVLLETSSNQNFIFGTNKLRENVGASQMIWRSGMELVLRHLPDALFDQDPIKIRQKLRNNGGRLSDGSEILTIASGKAMVLMPDIDKARKLVTEATRAALSELPGVELRGAIVDSADTLPFDEAVRRVHARLEELRAHVPGPESRFLRLPVIADCTASRYPACHIDTGSPEAHERGPEYGLISALSQAKRENRDSGLTRLHAAIQKAAHRQLMLARDIEELEKTIGGLDWLAVIHADGNGIGQIFQHFGRHLKTDDWSEAAARMLEFSLALDECGERAFADALCAAQDRWRAARQQKGRPPGPDDFLPVVPLVLGGDDLTALCDGEMAVPLVRDYLAAFEKETNAYPPIRDLAKCALGAPRLGTCAGIAIVKPHFPFHLAYELAEDLLKSAKKVKKRVVHGGNPFPCSALDFHVHYDASGADLDHIRSLMRGAGGARLYGGPYVVTPTKCLAGADDQNWAEAHAFARLEGGVTALRDSNEDEPIPRSILHELREALFLGQAQAEDRLRLVLRRRPRDKSLRDLLDRLGHDKQPDGEPSLFRREYDLDTKKDIAVSGLLDALNLRELWQ